MKYLDLTIIKSHLNINEDFTLDDVYLEHLGEVVEVVVEKHIDDDIDVLIEEEGNGSIPTPLKQAMLILIATYYSNREAIAYGAPTQIPLSFNYLLDLYKNYGGRDYHYQSILKEVYDKLAELEEYKNYDSERTIEGGESVSVITEGQTTKIEVDKIDGGMY